MNLDFLDTPLKDLNTSSNHEIKPVRNYQVILHNSDYAEFNCILNSLLNTFGMSHDKAMQAAQTAHHNGSVCIGEWVKDIAESKAAIAQDSLREHHNSLGQDEPSNVYTSVPIG